MPNFLRRWFLKQELAFWKYQMESLAIDIENENNSETLQDSLYSRYQEYEKVYKMIDDLLMNNI